MNLNNKLDIILEFNRIMSQESDIEFILQEIATFSKSLVNADRCSLFIYDTNTDELWTKIADGLDKEIKFPASKGIAGDVIKTKKPEIINDVYSDSRFNKDIDLQTGYKTKQTIAIPLLDANKNCIGILQVLNKHDGEFTKEDLDYLRILSNYAAIILNNALLLEMETTLIQQSKLAEMGTMFDNILHQWKQPLNIISIAASTSKFNLKHDTFNKEEIEHSFDEVLNQISFMNETTKNFRDFLNAKKSNEEFFIYSLVDKILSILTFKIDDLYINVEKNYDKSAKAYGISSDYAQVILSILNNAIDKFTKRDNLNKIVINIFKQDDNVVLKISDNGGEILENLLPVKLFNRYVTTKTNGSGLGLAICNTIITKTFKGSIKAYNENKNACFEIIIKSA